MSQIIEKIKKVTVLFGGLSSEREVSLISGKKCAEALERAGFEVTLSDPADQNFLRSLQDNPPDAVFNALHGKYGEDGCIQGALEILGIPYTHSNVKASAVAMDKSLTKKIVALHNVPVAEEELTTYEKIRAGDFSLPYPFVIKPPEEGSSVGVFLIPDFEALQKAEPKIAEFKNATLMLERYIPGRELTVAVLNGKPLAVTEIITKSVFYDFDSKYTEGGSSHQIPANLSDDVRDRVMSYAKIAHEAVGCSGLTRSDFRYDESDSGAIVFLEINTQPGMTPLSLAPEQAQYVGMSYEELVTKILEATACRR